MNALHRLIVFAFALSIVPLAAHAQSSVLTPAAAQGQKLAFDRTKGNCLACHTMRGSDVPSNVGPQLENLKARYPNRADLVAILIDETKRNPQTIMPPFGRNLILTPQEIDRIIDFLYTL